MGLTFNGWFRSGAAARCVEQVLVADTAEGVLKVLGSPGRGSSQEDVGPEHR